MPDPVFHGAASNAFNGAVIGAVTGGLLWAILKATKLDQSLGLKKTPTPPRASAASRSDTAAAYPTPASYWDVPAPPPTQTALIAVMWTLSILAILSGALFPRQGLGVSLLIDLPAFVIAIVLLCKPGATNKWNGGAKMAMELIAFLGGFLMAARQAPLPSSIGIQTLPGLSSPAQQTMPAPPTMPRMQTMPGAPPNWPQPQGHIVPPPQFHAPPAPPMPPMPQSPFGR